MKNVENLEKQLDNAILAIEAAKLQIKKQISHIESLQTRNEYQPYFHKFKIIKQMMRLICQGYDEENALDEVAASYKNVLRRENIAYLWRVSRHDRNAINLYARIYMAKKMRLAGFKLSEIALSMNLSMTSINKLLKTDAVLDWFFVCVLSKKYGHIIFTIWPKM